MHSRSSWEGQSFVSLVHYMSVAVLCTASLELNWTLHIESKDSERLLLVDYWFLYITPYYNEISKFLAANIISVKDLQFKNDRLFKSKNKGAMTTALCHILTP